LHVLDSMLHYGHDHLHSNLFRRILHPWRENKATLIFAVELQAQAVQFLFYLTFFCIVLTYYGMPINLFREVYVSFASLKERLGAFFKYRRLMAGMNRFQAPTESELEEQGHVCIICRDDMTVRDCKRLPVCRHIFHKSCLREWLVQQQSCPTCRSDIATMQAQEAAANAAARRGLEQEQAAQQQGVSDGEETEIATDHVDIRAQDFAAFTDYERESGAVVVGGGSSTASDEAIVGGESRRRDKKVRFSSLDKRVTGSTSFPKTKTLYKVIRASGASVAKDDGTVFRNVAEGVLVLGVGEVKLLDDQITRLVRIPDGWVPEDALVCMHTFDS